MTKLSLLPLLSSLLFACTHTASAVEVRVNGATYDVQAVRGTPNGPGQPWFTGSPDSSLAEVFAETIGDSLGHEVDGFGPFFFYQFTNEGVIDPDTGEEIVVARGTYYKFPESEVAVNYPIVSDSIVIYASARLISVPDSGSSLSLLALVFAVGAGVRRSKWLVNAPV